MTFLNPRLRDVPARLALAIATALVACASPIPPELQERIRSADMLDWTLVSRVVRDFYAGNMSLAEPLWFLLTFEMWREHWD